ncbi:hypothetical protein [Alteribacter populi]|uniref:hypothetical protein n=1 Tax=Alteribacter populi TaxID=2011011 RepID=UPI000BBA43A6|nr:hypothetical protein [Alteribacter populi]
MGGWKAIEMQVALPRTQTAGKIQDQLQQRSMQTQGHLAATEKKQMEKRRAQVTKNEKSEQKRIANDQEKRGNSKFSQNQRRSPKEDDNSKMKDEGHPYKGRNIDFTW